MKTRRVGALPEVAEIGLGGMYLSIAGRPSEDDAVRAIEAAIDLGVTLFDTADVYCLDDADRGHNERLFARALRGKKGAFVIATKGGLGRPSGSWSRDARPASLVKACEASLAALGTDVIDIYQLHAPDPQVPFADSVGTIAELRRAGKVRHVGLSNVSVAEIEEARAIVPIASVQNRWNPSDRGPETDGELAYCAANDIAFLPYSPFGGARGAKSLGDIGGGALGTLARTYGVSPHRLVVAWQLAKSHVVIPIPGGRRIESFTDTMGASTMALGPEDVAKIEASFGS